MTAITFLEVDKEDQKPIRKHFPDAEVIEGPLNGKELVDACANAEVVSAFIYSRFTKEILTQLPALRLLCTRSVGYDHIDLEAAKAQGITVCNVPDYGSHVIAEHVFALLLSTLRHIPEALEKLDAGTFDYHGLRGIALRDKTMGIVGTGKIGRIVAEIAHGFGMQVIAVDQCRTLRLTEELGVEYVTLDDLLRRSDIITLHVPEMKETKHMIDEESLQKMKDGAILVNTARGSLIDSRALLNALQTGKVKYALLDVLEHEQNFEENKELLSHPNVVATPHIAFYADDSMRNMYVDSFRSIDQWLYGKEPDHVIRPLNIVCDLPPIRK
jgi:D-lactate dehydrogenase